LIENIDIFTAIKEGKKKMETRAASPKYQDIKEGDTIVFSCEDSTFKKKVVSAKRFDSIEKILEEYGPSDINPKVKNREELEKMYYSFPGYEEKIRKYGFIVIGLADL